MKRCSTLTLLIVVCTSFYTSSQTIDNIKSKSDEHSSSGSSGSSSSSSSSDDDDDLGLLYYGFDFFATTSSSSSSGGGYSTPHAWTKREEDPKFVYVDLGYRQSLDPRRVVLHVPEIQLNAAGYYASIRVNALTEPRVDGTDDYSTTDVQFLGFQTYPKGKWVFNVSTGVLVENYNEKAYMESVVGLRRQIKNKYRIYSEGRICIDGPAWVRSEGTVGAEAIIRENNFCRLGITGFYTASLYYESVPVEGFGLGLNLHF